METKLEFVKFDKNAKTPTRNTEFSAGLDLYSNVNHVIKPNDRFICNLDIGLLWGNSTKIRNSYKKWN